MNHKYLFLLLACSAGVAQAQRVNKPQAPQWARPEQAAPAHAERPPADDLVARDAGDVVFYEDFANGFAGNNGFGAWTTNELDGNLWKYTTGAPFGAYTDPSEKINSTTVANGFMILNTDSANTDWSDTTIVADPVDWDAALVSPLLDLSATPNVRVEFEMAGRWCCGEVPWYVQVSTNGGTTWGGTTAILPSQAINVGTSTVTASANLSCGISSGSASSVKFRFFHDGTTSGSSHYHWQIDDVKLIVLNDYDLALLGGAHSDWSSSTAFTYDSLRYSVFPFGQLRPVPLNMSLVNNGSQAQNGAVANFNVMEGSNTVLDQDQTIDVGPCAEKLFVNPDFVPPAVAGTYDITYSVTSSVGDTSTADNSATDQIKVSEFIYARDLGTVATYVSSTADGEYELCNGFHIANDAELYAVDVAIRAGGNPSPVGIPIVGLLKDGSDVELEIAESMEHTIASNELNGTNGTKFISLIFSEPLFLEAGLDYFVCIKHFGGAEVRTAVNGTSEDQSTFIYYDPPTDSPDQGLVWFYTNSTPMVRMNFNPSVGIEEADRLNGIGLGQNIPNPANGVTTIPFDLKEGANVRFEVQDLTGKTVATRTVGNRPAGSHRLQFDTDGLNEGVYFYSIVANGTRVTKRMMVIR